MVVVYLGCSLLFSLYVCVCVCVCVCGCEKFYAFCLMFYGNDNVEHVIFLCQLSGFSHWFERSLFLSSAEVCAPFGRLVRPDGRGLPKDRRLANVPQLLGILQRSRTGQWEKQHYNKQK
jgi:hypothetical protein